MISDDIITEADETARKLMELLIRPSDKHFVQHGSVAISSLVGRFLVVVEHMTGVPPRDTMRALHKEGRNFAKIIKKQHQDSLN
jgi:hypothetical protein